jgi:hypothetical protein
MYLVVEGISIPIMMLCVSSLWMCFLIALMLYNRTNHVNVKYHKPPVCNCHSEDTHSIIIGILIPSTTKYINMSSILFIVPFYDAVCILTVTIAHWRFMIFNIYMICPIIQHQRY